MPGQRQQLPDTASSAEGTQRLEIRNIEGDLTSRGVGVAELYGSDRRGGQPDRRHPSLSDDLVARRRQESHGDLEREIACAGIRFSQRAANVVLMGESIEDKLACGSLGAQTESRCHGVDRLPPQVE